MKNIIINILIIFSILFIIIWSYTKKEEENKIEEKSGKQINQEQNIQKQETKEYPKEEIIQEYKGYVVGAKLEIPAIFLETYILGEYSNKALKTSVTKFWGVNPNEIGNYCIAGHNFKNKKMFYNLKKLKIGDKIFISDNKTGKVEYEVYNLYKVIPEDVTCLEQETNGKREVTLITCTNDSKKRIIVKAKEVE